MKKILFVGLIVGIVCSANASDDGFENYFIGQTTKSEQPMMVPPAIREPVVTEYVVKQPVVKKKCSKCSKCQKKQIRVKDYTEVIEHYQVFEPVTIYKPVGTYSERHVIEPRCNRCGY